LRLNSVARVRLGARVAALASSPIAVTNGEAEKPAPVARLAQLVPPTRVDLVDAGRRGLRGTARWNRRSSRSGAARRRPWRSDPTDAGHDEPLRDLAIRDHGRPPPLLLDHLRQRVGQVSLDCPALLGDRHAAPGLGQQVCQLAGRFVPGSAVAGAALPAGPGREGLSGTLWEWSGVTSTASGRGLEKILCDHGASRTSRFRSGSCRRIWLGSWWRRPRRRAWP
jgi:hypothetical protein